MLLTTSTSLSTFTLASCSKLLLMRVLCSAGRQVRCYQRLLWQAVQNCFFFFFYENALKLQGKYAINVYFDKLFELLSLCEVVDTRHKYQDDVSRMLALLCRYMSSAHIKEAAFIFKRSHGRSTSEQVRKLFFFFNEVTLRKVGWIKEILDLLPPSD